MRVSGSDESVSVHWLFLPVGDLVLFCSCCKIINT